MYVRREECEESTDQCRNQLKQKKTMQATVECAQRKLDSFIHLCNVRLQVYQCQFLVRCRLFGDLLYRCYLNAMLASFFTFTIRLHQRKTQQEVSEILSHSPPSFSPPSPLLSPPHPPSFPLPFFVLPPTFFLTSLPYSLYCLLQFPLLSPSLFPLHLPLPSLLLLPPPSLLLLPPPSTFLLSSSPPPSLLPTSPLHLLQINLFSRKMLDLMSSEDSGHYMLYTLVYYYQLALTSKRTSHKKFSE